MLEKIEQLITSVRQVSDNIAHDMRTPLTRLRNRLEQLKVGEALDEVKRSSLLNDADTMLSMFAGLLRIARVEAGSAQANFMEADLGRLVDDVAEYYEPLAEEKGIAFDVCSDELNCFCDRDLLFQALANIVDNAIKFSQSGGRVTLAIIDCDDTARVVITDTGKGIDKNERDKVFRRFYRGDASRSCPGHGLGLSLVQAIVERHHGSIEFQDHHPGLRVVIDIPLAIEFPLP
jgi:signal transduction histidine kinase